MGSPIQISESAKKHLQDFAVAYFFIFKIQLENAELIEKSFNSVIPRNSLLLEFAHGYIYGSVSEFVLSLYDTVEFLKKTTGVYKYKAGGAIERVFKFRRHILAHRACNWGSNESKETIDLFSQSRIFQICHEAAEEFSQDLRVYIVFTPLQNVPLIQKIRKPDLLKLFNDSPALAFHRPVPSEDEVIKFFGSNMRAQNE